MTSYPMARGWGTGGTTRPSVRQALSTLKTPAQWYAWLWGTPPDKATPPTTEGAREHTT